MKKGFFLTFEGAEGSGKSTQIKRAAAHLRKMGKRVLLLREPGGTRVSEAIRSIILNKKFREMSDATELLLYFAARAQIVREKIVPALKAGKVVICDRFEDSTLAYQGFGRKIPLKTIGLVSRELVRGALVPNLTFLLDIPPSVGLTRGGRHDRIERQSLEFHRRVRRGFLALAKKNPGRFRVLNALGSKETIARKITAILEKEI